MCMRWEGTFFFFCCKWKSFFFKLGEEKREGGFELVCHDIEFPLWLFWQNRFARFFSSFRIFSTSKYAFVLLHP